MSAPDSIAIVGSGFSGTMVAAHLLKHARSPLTIHLIERVARQFGRGVAYGTAMDCHLLNVPAGNMSAFPDDPEHFLSWAGEREHSLANPPWMAGVTATAFLPRRAYGDYLCWVLGKAEAAARPGVRLERRVDEAVDLRVGPEGVDLRLLGGSDVAARKVVLAVGNFRPGNPALADSSFYQTSRYHGDPWSSALLADILQTESCLLIGSGLTMVDWALSLSDAGYRGTIHALSRRGLWPQPHAQYVGVEFALETGPRAPTVPAWLHRIREFIRCNPCDWRAVIDALRPRTQDLWQSLPVAEQRRFLHHLRPYWDCHRHRVAPAVAKRLHVLLAAGRLRRHVGRIQDFRPGEGGVDVLIRERGRTEPTVLRTDVVLNCSGSESDYRKLDSPLVQSLLHQSLAAPDPLRLGFAVDRRGSLLDRNGIASPFLYTLGPPQKGVLWETTAVPEIRGQAAHLAAVLLDHPVL